MFALKRDTEERSIPDKLKYLKSTTQNTEGELYLTIDKRGVIINQGTGKIIPPKKDTILTVRLVTNNITNLFPIEAGNCEVL